MTNDEVVVGSDLTAILAITKEIIILEDGDLAEVKIAGLIVENQGRKVSRQPQVVHWDAITAQKGGYKHFMHKEIHEQVQTAVDSIRGRLDDSSLKINIDSLTTQLKAFDGVERVLLLACGSAWHAALIGKFLIERFAGISCDVDYASEFRYRTFSQVERLLGAKTLAIFISQSGETADTLAAVDKASKGAKLLALCNVLGSSLARKIDSCGGSVFYTQAGPEISVASTKAFTAQILAFYILSLALAEKRDLINKEELDRQVTSLLELPTAITATLKLEKEIKSLARKFHASQDFLFLGRGLLYPIALEGALKLKEISYIHAEGYPAGEMKHGPLALIDEKMPVVGLLQGEQPLFDKTLSNLKEVESRSGRLIIFTDAAKNNERRDELAKIAEEVIYLPSLTPELAPIIFNVPLQLLAYHVAVMKGSDVDLPRNLAKSVTVE
jgi:glucosamine--fructose-6-phosphate aminotransferase (isomerizing)